MAAPSSDLFHRLRRVVARPSANQARDGALLDRWIGRRDEEAFAELFRRHAPMVLRVCSRVLNDAHAAEDCMQAAFLVLARKATSISPRDAVSAWLHGVARRLALKARAAEQSRRKREAKMSNQGEGQQPADLLEQMTARELVMLIDQEVQCLPKNQRLAIVLCCLEGRSQEQAAEVLGWTLGSVKGRLERGRHRLQVRLAKRGIELSTALLAVEVGGVQDALAVMPSMALAAARAAAAFAAGSGVAELPPASQAAAGLARQLLVGKLATQVKITAAVLLMSGMFGAAALAPQLQSNEEASKEPPAAPAKREVAKSKQAAGLLAVQAPSRGRIVGTVTVAGTTEPVAGTKLQVVEGKVHDGRYQWVTGATDSNGHYSIDVPIGHARLAVLRLPAGYWTDSSSGNALTSPAVPVFTKHYSVHRGPTWRVRVRNARQHLPVRGATCAVSRKEAERHVSSFSDTDEQGTATVTLPGFNGDFQVAVGVWERDDKWEPTLARFSIEKGFHFEETSVVKPTAKKGSFEIRDKNGKVATVQGAARVVLERGSVLVDFDLVSIDTSTTAEIVGTISDDKGKPIADASVTVVQGSKTGSSATTELSTTSGADGRFTIRIATSPAVREPGDQVSLVVVKDGYAGLDSPSRDYPADPKARVDFGRIALARGNSIRVRVLTADGQPAVGAWVEPTRSYAVRNQLTTTDARGECVVQNLPQGVTRLSVTYGDTYANDAAVVGEADARVTLRLQPISKAASAPTKRPEIKPIKVGAPAPALSVSGWTDGKARTLDGYRGKVVVLDFCGIWCSACAIVPPAMRTLEAKYKDREVVFLSIHTAGTDLDQIRTHQSQSKRESPIGLDAGDNVANGVTARAYGVRGYPTILLIGRDGRVAWSSEQTSKAQAMKTFQRAAKALSIPWPIDETAPEEKLIEQVSRIEAYLIAEAVDQALAKR